MSDEEKKSAVTPLSLLNPKNYGEKDIGTERYNICLQCPELIKVTKQCRKCGCFMVAKTKLANATCPLGKWQLWYNSIMPTFDDSGTLVIPQDGDPANIVTAFTQFSESLVTQLDNNGNTRFSGLLDVDEYASPQAITNDNLNALVVFTTAVGSWNLDVDTLADRFPVGFNFAVVHLDSANDLVAPTLPAGIAINWTGLLPAFTIASIVKVSDTQYVSTFGDV